MFPFRRLLAIAGLAGLVNAGPAAAAEWKLAADVSQRVEADSNFRLRNNSNGVLFGSTTAGNLRLGVRTKLTNWNLSTGGRISQFVGKGDDSGLNTSDPRLNGGVRHEGKRYSANAGFGFSRQSVAFTQFGTTPLPDGSIVLPDGAVILPDDTVGLIDDFETITNDNATETKFNLRSGVTFNLDPINRLSLSASGAVVRFSGDATELEDSTRYGTNVSWAHDLTELTSSNLSFGISQFTVDDVENTESLTLRTAAGFDTQLTPRLNFGFDAGVNVADISRDPPGHDQTTTGFTGSLQLGWQLADTSFSLSARQGFEPSSIGELQSRSTAGLSVEHSINSRSQVSLSASYSRQTSAGSSSESNAERQLFALSPGYSIDLSPDWRAKMGYTLRLRDDKSGFATSNNIFVSISRSFDLLR